MEKSFSNYEDLLGLEALNFRYSFYKILILFEYCTIGEYRDG